MSTPVRKRCKVCNKIGLHGTKGTTKCRKCAYRLYVKRHPIKVKRNKRLTHTTRTIKEWEKIHQHYGDKCIHCKEDDKRSLTLDHVNNDGHKHRRLLNNGNSARFGGGVIRRWAIKNNYPDTIQVLCFNCNCVKQINGGVMPDWRKNKYGLQVS